MIGSRPTDTNIGIDDRNQFDFFRTMPGGLDAVTKVTAELHAKGVKVLWPYNPWDLGTRREPVSDADTFAKLLKQTVCVFLVLCFVLRPRTSPAHAAGRLGTSWRHSSSRRGR